ncbi:MAG: EAL domain-containing protein [Rhizobiaceae bacterium]|nr:EAL domain-containing protein [Rhizobiaceae bacterium]MCV0408003.1 EAL domain-containing protein [Rhizobiaceae bacterium]
MRRTLFLPAYLPALLACLAVIGFAVHFESQNQTLARERERAAAQNELGLLRARLEGNISADIQLVRGLVAVMATEPDMDQKRFDQLAGQLVRQSRQIINVAAAPDLVVTMVHPFKGNEAAIGLDYRTNEAQRDAALRTRVSGNLVLAGPVNLVQGGTGFIGRFPVFVDQGQTIGGFWGLLSVVIDANSLYSDSGLTATDLNLDVAIAGRDGGRSGGRGGGEVFFGDDAIMADDPVLARVYLPSGSWLMAARPRGGWSHSHAPWRLRGLMALVGLAIAVPLLAAGHYSAQRKLSVDALRRRESELEDLSQRLGLALETSHIGVWEMDLSRNEIYWDHRLHEIYGIPYDPAPKTFADWDRAVHPDDLAQAMIDFSNAVDHGKPYSSQFRIVRADGTERHLAARATIHVGADGSRRMIGAEWDVTEEVVLNKALERAKTLAETRSAELEAANRQIAYNALHDPLTGLPNRRSLDETLAAVRAAEPGGAVALLHLDLDRFKQINDTLGHAAGDAMLVHTATVLRDKAGADDLVARVGGDEFVMLCRSAADEYRLALRAERLVDAMRQPVPFEGHECRFGVSIGIASGTTGPHFDPAKLMVDADIALYRAKSRGRNRFEFFTASLEAEIVQTKRLADEILSGLERGEFVAWYQPQVCARTFAVTGYEALARWNHPERGVLPPAAFLKIAEELNVVSAIDRVVLEQALVQRQVWSRAGLGDLRVSVNVSARRLAEDDLIGSLRQMNIPKNALSFELVESIFLDEGDEVIAWNVDRVKDLGIDVEIDDFGTGYASIVSLLKLKPRRLKIDRQLITPIAGAPGQRHLVQSIIEIGKSLDIEVVAEGVETLEHARLLRKMGCDLLQGYAFSKPLNAQDFENHLRLNRPRKAG